MTIQITARLADDLVEYVDARVAAGKSANRTEVISAALRHERRREAQEHDVAIYAAAANDPDPELDAWTTHAAGTPLSDLD